MRVRDGVGAALGAALLAWTAAGRAAEVVPVVHTSEVRGTVGICG